MQTMLKTQVLAPFWTKARPHLRIAMPEGNCMSILHSDAIPVIQGEGCPTPDPGTSGWISSSEYASAICIHIAISGFFDTSSQDRQQRI